MIIKLDKLQLFSTDYFTSYFLDESIHCLASKMSEKRG